MKFILHRSHEISFLYNSGHCFCVISYLYSLFNEINSQYLMVFFCGFFLLFLIDFISKLKIYLFILSQFSFSLHSLTGTSFPLFLFSFPYPFCFSCSMVVKGVVCKKNVAHRRMTSKVEKARLLILGGALEYQRVSNLLSSFDTLLQQVVIIYSGLLYPPLDCKKLFFPLCFFSLIGSPSSSRKWII